MVERRRRREQKGEWEGWRTEADEEREKTITKRGINKKEKRQTKRRDNRTRAHGSREKLKEFS